MSDILTRAVVGGVTMLVLAGCEIGAKDSTQTGYRGAGLEQITDRSSRFLAAELVREKIMRQMGAELPYQITVEIEEFKQQGKTLHIHALILVERDGQKKIIIGDKGERIKRIGTEARKDMELLFDSKIMLNLWVKVKGGWSDDERALRSLGYGDL